MKVLMISIDRGLLGQGQMGDVVERHVAYGQQIDKLDIIVFSHNGFKDVHLSNTVTSYPTNSSSKIRCYFDALKIGKKLCSETHYDLVVTQEPFLTGLVGLKLKRLLNTKLLVHFHGDFWQNPKWLQESTLNYIFLPLSKYVVKNADKVRVVSGGIKRKLLSQGIADNKVVVLPTLVNLEKYDVTDEIPREGKLVLHVGRYDQVKDLPLLAEAFKKVKSMMPDATLLQIGGGQKAQNELIGEGVSVKPMTDHKELVKYFHLARVLVLSSKSESLGKVLIEANASGTPVVSTNTTGAQEIIEDGVNGYLVPIGDAEKLAEKIIYLLSNPTVAEAMGQRGEELVRKKFSFTPADVTNLWNEIVNS